MWRIVLCHRRDLRLIVDMDSMKFRWRSGVGFGWPVPEVSTTVPSSVAFHLRHPGTRDIVRIDRDGMRITNRGGMISDERGLTPSGG